MKNSLTEWLLLLLALALSIGTLVWLWYNPEEEIKVYICDTEIEFDVPPQTVNDRTMVPIRAIFEAMGAEVEWDNATQTATSKKDNTTVKMALNSTTEYINGQAVAMDVAPVVIDGRTLAPARYVAEAFGYYVRWDDKTKSAFIDIPKEIHAGEVFEPGSFITAQNIKITYDGENFVLDNNNDCDYIVTCSVYGKKNDGEYTWIGTPAFYGIDQTQYNKDHDENGWAIADRTNRVRAHDRLTAKLEIYDFGGDDVPAWDIDGDGYYDISFTFDKQPSNGHIQVSTSAPQSDYYRLKANEEEGSLSVSFNFG